jgi:hypothetical protein
MIMIKSTRPAIRFREAMQAGPQKGFTLIELLVVGSGAALNKRSIAGISGLWQF